MRKVGIEIASAAAGRLQSRLRLPGEIVLNADRTAHLVPPAAGIVRKVLKKLGDPVEKGEPMALLESGDIGEARVNLLSQFAEMNCCSIELTRAEAVHRNTLKLLTLLDTSPSLEQLKTVGAREEMGENRSQLVSAYADIVLAKATYVREKELFDQKVGSRSDFLEAENAFKKAEAVFLATRDSITYNVQRDLLETQQKRRLTEHQCVAAERALFALGQTKEDIEALSTAAQGGAPAEHECSDPNCENCKKARAAGTQPSTEAVGEKLAWYTLRAPFSGTVIEKHITLGERLGEDANAFTIADLRTVWVNLSAYQKDLLQLRKGQKVTVIVGPDSAPVAGAITYISPTIDPSTRTGLVRVELANPKGHLRPGLFVSAEVVGEREEVVLLPKSAVQRIDGETVVFVPEGKGGFEARVVRTGGSNRTLVEVVSGLSPGQPYVFRGAFALKAKIVTSGLDPHAGHGH